MNVASAVLGLTSVAIKFGVSLFVDKALSKDTLASEALKYLVTVAAVAIFTKMSDAASEAATNWHAGRNVVPIPVDN